jgi:hypothetical protein
MAECTYCGGFVTDDYARVFGDNENRVDDCRNCPTRRPTQEEEADDDDGREVLLREVDETAAEDDETAAREQRESRDRAPTPGTDRADRTDDGAKAEADGESDRGRLQSGLDAMVSALRS